MDVVAHLAPADSEATGLSDRGSRQPAAVALTFGLQPRRPPGDGGNPDPCAGTGLRIRMVIDA
jgi:hypothetical protein